MRRTGKRKIEKLSATIERLLEARGLGARLQEYRVFGIWDHAVGGVIARHAQPTVVRGRKLTVIVDSSAWMQQLSLLRPVIIEKLNNALGRGAIESITLKMGVILREAGSDAEKPEVRGALAPDERERIDQYLQNIGDQEVRESLRHLMVKDLLHKKLSK